MCIVAGLFLGDKRIMLFSLCLQHGQRKSIAIEKQVIHKAVLCILEIIAKLVQVLLLQLHVGFKGNIGLSFIVAEESPTCSLQKIIYKNACFGFLTHLRIPHRHIQRIDSHDLRVHRHRIQNTSKTHLPSSFCGYDGRNLFMRWPCSLLLRQSGSIASQLRASSNTTVLATPRESYCVRTTGMEGRGVWDDGSALFRMIAGWIAHWGVYVLNELASICQVAHIASQY